MQRALGYLLALIVLGGVAYGIYVFAPRAPQVSVEQTTGTNATSGTQMKVENVNESTDAYRIDARYPQFGIASVDAKIRGVVDSAVSEFKGYPANPPDSSASQNELTGSFNRVYVGPDVVSVELALSEYTGGAHSNTAIIGVNVDPRSGKGLALDDALAMIGKNLQQVAEQSQKELKAKLGDDVISPEGADPKPDNYSTFIVSKDKVTFIFNAYQVAPYSAGSQEVSFPRKK